MRIVAMIGVFAAHSAQPFNPWDAWHVQAPTTSKWLGELVLFLAPWVIPLFFVVAGMSAWHSLAKRSAWEYLNERVIRLVVPLAIGIVVIVPPQIYYDRVQHGQFQGSFAGFYPYFFDGIYPEGNFTWAHLWFLAVLAAIAAVTLPLFQWMGRPRGRHTMANIAQIGGQPLGLLVLVLPLVATRAVLWWMFPHVRPIKTDWANRTTLLPMFVYGYMLAGEPRLIHAVDRQWKPMLAVAMTFSSGMFAWAWPGSFIDRLPDPFSPFYVVVWSIYTLGGWAWCVALVGAARAWRSRSSAVIRRAATLLNPFYMLHQTIIVVLAFYLVRARPDPIVGYVVLFTAAFAVTATLASLATRWRTSRFLLGVRTPLPVTPR